MNETEYRRLKKSIR